MENLPNYLLSKASLMLSFVQRKELFRVICSTKKLHKVVLIAGTVNLFLSCSGNNSNTRLPDHFCGVYEAAIFPKWDKLSSKDYLEVYFELQSNGFWRLMNAKGEIGKGTFKSTQNVGVKDQNTVNSSKRNTKDVSWNIFLSADKGSYSKYLTEKITLKYSKYIDGFGKNTFYFFCDISNGRIVFLKVRNQNIPIEQRARKIPNNAIRIGNQYWMRKNLNLDTFQNGDIIPEAKTKDEWQNAARNKQPAWCYAHYDYDGFKYGKLYNWYAIADRRGLAPKGWRIPSHGDWGELLDYLKMQYKEYSVEWTMEKASDALRDRNWYGAGGTDDTGFSALPGGKRLEKGAYLDEQVGANWWSVSEKDDINAYTFSIHNNDIVVNLNLSRYPASKGNGFSVRCILE